MNKKINKEVVFEFDTLADSLQEVDTINADCALTNDVILSVEINLCKHRETGKDYYVTCVKSFDGDLNELHEQAMFNLQQRMNRGRSM